jgi:chromosomal replication initiation ATPase DnaA
LATPTNIVIPASTRAAIEFDFEFETFGEKKLCEMLTAAKDFVRDMTIGAAPRWLSLLGWSGTGKTHLARGISRFFKANASVYIDPATGAHLSRRGGFIGWRRIIDHLRDGDYEIMRVVCGDWFVALDDIGAERASDFSVSKLDQIVDARLGKWTMITCNFTRQQIADHMDVRIASRLGAGTMSSLIISAFSTTPLVPKRKWPEGATIRKEFRATTSLCSSPSRNLTADVPVGQCWL